MGMKKINKVSWASGPKLCQVKHFLSEDCPSKVGCGSQHRLQLKSSHVNNIRPAFEGKHCLKQSKESLPCIPQAKWKCPPKFTLNDKWCVVAGEESNETAAQKHREKRVLEAVYPSRSAIPPNSSTLLDLDQSYDDSQTPVIPIIPIEEEAVLEVSSHLTPSNELQDPCSSSISIETSQTLPANGKSFSLSFSTSQKVRVPQSSSHISLTQPANGQSAPPSYLSRSQNLDRYEQSLVSPKPPVNHKPVPKHSSTCQDLSVPLHQTEFSPKLPANHNLGPTYRSTCENLNIPQLKSQVSGMPPANHHPVPQCPSTRVYMSIPKHQTEVLPKPLANHNAATRCQSTYENLNLRQYKTQISAVPPSNGICVPQYQSTENLSFQDKSQVCSNPPANEKSTPEIPHSFEGDMMAAAATAVAALAKSQEPGSLIDTDLLIKLLSNPKQIQELMKEHQLVTNPKTGAASDSRPIGPSTTTPSPTAGSLDKQIAGNEHRDPVADSTAFSNTLVRNTNEQREIAAISRPVDLPLPRIKSDKVINQPASERQALYARSTPIFGPKPMAKSVSLAVSNPEKPMISNLVNGQGALPHVGIADNRGIRPLVTPDLNMEKVKKLINEYGAPDGVRGRPVLSSPNIVHTSPFSSMSSTPAPAHKDINYYKSLIKQHGENRESVDQELVQNTSRYGNRQGPELLKNLKANQSGLNFQKHCVFFNKPKGCLNGSSCPFLHDTTKQWRSGGMLEAPSSKRVKLGGELTGSM